MIDTDQPDYSVAEISLTALDHVEGAYPSAREGRALTLPLSANGPVTVIDWDPGMPYGGSGSGRDGRQFG